MGVKKEKKPGQTPIFLHNFERSCVGFPYWSFLPFFHKGLGMKFVHVYSKGNRLELDFCHSALH